MAAGLFTVRCRRLTHFASQALNQIHLIDFSANRRYLLEKTQHQIGGFGKLPGDPPGTFGSSFRHQVLVLDVILERFDANAPRVDIMHSYLGLAALACMGEPDLKSIDPALCFSVSVREALKSRMAAQP